MKVMALSEPLVLGHLYPELLNLYGDRGNVTAVLKRCQWRGLPVILRPVHVGEWADFRKFDLLFIGGGSDREMAACSADFLRRAENLNKAVEGGLVVLAVCGGYQLLGRYYQPPGRKPIPGLGILDFYTVAGPRRLVGNAAADVRLGGMRVRLAGFENHLGRTYLGRVEPLGKVVFGYGNNGYDGTEGARYKNVFCTYLHGPLLPKNPAFSDYLIGLAAQRKGLAETLNPLDDGLENAARRAACKLMGLKETSC